MVTAGHSLRIVFFGTPEFAVPTLEALIASNHPVAGVVTQPDRPKGRGQAMQPSPVKAAALRRGLAVLQPARLKDEAFLQELRNLKPDLGVVAAYGKILTDEVLSIPRFGLINVHASLLPKYRGAAPIHRAVMAGEESTGVTIMRIVKALDAGPMLSSVSRAIGPDDTSIDVERALADLGARALVESVDAISAGTARETPQQDDRSTYAPRLEKSDGIVDWSRSAVDIHNQIRGLYPWPHAFSEIGGERIILLRSRVESEDMPSADRAPGSVVQAQGDVLTVQTGNGLLRLLELQREGRRPVSAREFIAGRPLAADARFVKPAVGT